MRSFLHGHNMFLVAYCPLGSLDSFFQFDLIHHHLSSTISSSTSSSSTISPSSLKTTKIANLNPTKEENVTPLEDETIQTIATKYAKVWRIRLFWQIYFEMIDCGRWLIDWMIHIIYISFHFIFLDSSSDYFTMALTSWKYRHPKINHTIQVYHLISHQILISHLILYLISDLMLSKMNY